MARDFNPSQPRNNRGEWAGGAAKGIKGGKPKPAKAKPDLSTPQARSAAVANADLSTPAGRSLVARAQRAAQQAAMGGVSGEEMTRRAQVMHGSPGAPKPRGKSRKSR